ncbi:MAG TPA: nicotinate-nucleotide--dimethylbenzimidazole phosphoribosyltransferase [Bacteroidia bacterium]|nr:nicotinate-nucleotide--dimethylbenzimidazole phosphoribosyltransferase [Bacteroidia bacterium]
MKSFHIEPLSKKLEVDLKYKIDYKTKPTGALGKLEAIALQIGLIQNTLTPELKNPHIVVFAGDHGITNEGISAYPQEVTFQMVMNFVNGGAAINIFCKQNNISLKIVDTGVNYEFPTGLNIIDSKIALGTKNFLKEPAMSIKQAEKCMDMGAQIVNELFHNGCNVIGFGEMGIGNTSSASALMSLLCNLPVKLCVGQGAGLDDNRLNKKIDVIERAIATNGKMDTSLKILAAFGGFEIAQMCGAMLQAAENKMLVLVDGFISTSAFLIAHKMNPAILDYTIFCHQSGEQGHAKMLKYLNVEPILNLNMRLGEGTGAAISYSIIQSAVNFLNEMASFKSAGVSNTEKNLEHV